MSSKVTGYAGDRALPVASTPLAARWRPEILAYAFDPGNPCPCTSQYVIPSTWSRTFRVEYTVCEGVMRKELVTTYTKDDWDGVSDEELWNAAWDEMIHTEVWEPTAENDRAELRGWNLTRVDERTDVKACPLPEKTIDEWIPGPPVENPGVATYTEVPEETLTEFPDTAGMPSYTDMFEGEFDVAGASSLLSYAADSKSSSAFKTEFYWSIDLTEWPTTQPWPPGYEFTGTLVWWIGTIEYDNDDPDLDFTNLGSIPWESQTMQTEDFHIDADNRKWEGVTRVVAPSGSVAAGRTRATYIVAPPVEYLFVPFS